MANISLEGSIRTCKVDTAWANKMESDRFLNPNTMVCPVWNGYDTSGRSVCPDSYYAKTAGCFSAADRVNVENDLRPKYIEYVNLDAAGIRGGQQCKMSGIKADTILHQQSMNDVHKQTGQFGLTTGYNQYIYPNCVTCSHAPAATTQKTTGDAIVEKYMEYMNMKRAEGYRY